MAVLDRQDVEAIAAATAPRVAALLRSDSFPSRGLVKAELVAELLEVDVSWVYENKRSLGAVRIGEGRGVLRFEASSVIAYLRERRLDRPDGVTRERPGPRRRRSLESIDLLPLPDNLR